MCVCVNSGNCFSELKHQVYNWFSQASLVTYINHIDSSGQICLHTAGR